MLHLLISVTCWYLINFVVFLFDRWTCVFASPPFSYSFHAYSIFMAVVSLNCILSAQLMLSLEKKSHYQFYFYQCLLCSYIFGKVTNIYLFCAYVQG